MSSAQSFVLPFEAIPGPPRRWWGFPLLAAMRRDYLPFSERLRREHGDMVRLHLGREQIVDLFHPEVLRSALIDQADALIRWERGIDVLAEGTGRNVLVTEGATWQRQRRMLAPTFTPKRVAACAEHMTGAAAVGFDAALPAGVSAAEVDMERLFSHLTMDVILRTLFGRPAGQATDSAEAHRIAATAQAVQTLNGIAFGQLFWPFTWPDWLPLPSVRARRAAIRQFHDLIAHHLARPEAAQGDTLLALLRSLRDEETGCGLDEQEVFDQCAVTFTAGHETTAAALVWWSALMSRHPQAAARASDEVDAALQGRVPGAADVARLPWLSATLKEAMRLAPPIAALMTRRTKRPIVLGGYQIPAGTMLRFTPWVLHRDERFFAEPARFQPERFLPDAEPPLRGTYLPFGIGPRVCLGLHFAQLEMTLIAAMLLQRFQLPQLREPLPKPQLRITLRPEAGLRLRLVRRAG